MRKFQKSQKFPKPEKSQIFQKSGNWKFSKISKSLKINKNQIASIKINKIQRKSIKISKNHKQTIKLIKHQHNSIKSCGNQ